MDVLAPFGGLAGCGLAVDVRDFSGEDAAATTFSEEGGGGGTGVPWVDALTLPAAEASAARVAGIPA